MLHNEHVQKLLLIIILPCCHLLAPNLSEGRTGPGKAISAKAAILIDAASGEVLFEKAADVPLPPASTTKVMTALVALEQNPPDAVMPVSKCATLAPPCKVNVHVDELWPLNKLLYCILLKSANDASIVIAEGTAGSVERFADLMNRKAAEIGASHTNFVNPHGLDEKSHYTTARDMALMFKYASSQPVFLQISRTWTTYITSPSAGTIVLKNHNRLLKNYPGMLCGKSGYTSRAKRCFVGKASRGGRELIVCVLGSRNHFRDAARLLDYGFKAAKKPVRAHLETGLSCADAVPVSNALGLNIQASSFPGHDRALDPYAEFISPVYLSFIESISFYNDHNWHRGMGEYTEWEWVGKTPGPHYQGLQPASSHSALARGIADGEDYRASTPVLYLR